jgi:hypothetical protein
MLDLGLLSVGSTVKFTLHSSPFFLSVKSILSGLIFQPSTGFILMLPLAVVKLFSLTSTLCGLLELKI